MNHAWTRLMGIPALLALGGALVACGGEGSDGGVVGVPAAGAFTPGTPGTPGAPTGGVPGVVPPTAGALAPTPMVGGPPAVPTAGTGAVPTPPAGGSGGVGGSPPGTVTNPGTVVVDNSATWGSFGGDLAHSRSNPDETMVSTANVGTLAPALTLSAPGVTATPALYKGVLYWSDWGGGVHATDTLTGTEVWSVDRSANGGGYTGSPAVTENHVFVANRNGLVSAFDRLSGTVAWETTIDAGPHTHIWSSPAVADDILVLGVGGVGTRDNGRALPDSQLETFRGWVQGIDALNGDPIWRFDVAPMPNGAGVSVWSSAAMDTVRKVAYIGTGNNYFRPVSSYSDSLLAINYETGQLKWSHQFTEGDAFTVGSPFGGPDADVGATPNLFTANGRDLVGVGDKSGTYYAHDRETGAQIWSEKLTRGGFQGGIMAPAAYMDGVIYVASNNGTSSSTMFALDAASGNTKWSAPLGDPTFGGPAVGGGIVFVGDTAGAMVGFDVSSGVPVWQQRLPGPHGGGIAFAGGLVVTGYGYHFSESRREPLTGGLIGYAIGGMVTPPAPTAPVSDCMTGYTLTANGTFTDVYQGVFCPQGCTKVCHTTSEEAGLNLEGKDIAYSRLVGVDTKGAACAGSGKLVAPGDPDASVLYQKFLAAPSCGVTMPPGGPGLAPTATEMQAMRAWISAGALNN